MTQEEWRRAYEAAPEGFCRAVQTALEQKEEHEMKKMIPRTAALVLALLVLLMGTALAVGIGLVDFLGIGDTGDVQVAAPEVISMTDGKVRIEVREAACDGIFAHVVAAFTLEDKQLVWDVHCDEIQEEDKARTVMFQEGQTVTVGEDTCWSYGFQYIQESDETIVADYLVDLRQMEGQLPEKLQLTCSMRMIDMDWQTMENCEFTVQVPVQMANRQAYTAVNLPCEQDNYRLLSAQVVRTDIGCYLTIEAEDIATAAEMEPYVESYVTMINRYPVHGNFGVNALDESGNAYRMLYAQSRHLNESDVETVVHLRSETICRRFNVGEKLIIQPFVGDARFEGQLQPITLRLQPR